MLAPSAPCATACDADRPSAGTARRGRAGGCGRLRPRATSSTIAGRDADHQQRAVGGVEDGIGERHRRPAARRAPRGLDPCSRDDEQRLERLRADRGGGRAIGADDDPAEIAAATLSGWPSSCVASSSRSPSKPVNARPPAARRRSPRALEPNPPLSGISERIANLQPSAGCRRSNAANDEVASGRRAAARSVTRSRTRRPR